MISQPKRRMLKIVNHKCRMVLAIHPARPAFFAFVIIMICELFIKFDAFVIKVVAQRDILISPVVKIDIVKIEVIINLAMTIFAVYYGIAAFDYTSSKAYRRQNLFSSINSSPRCAKFCGQSLC